MSRPQPRAAAPLAARFAAHCPVHALVAVDPPDESPMDLDPYVKEFDLDAVPAHYRDLITPAADPRLLIAYGNCIRLAGSAILGRPARLALHSQPPPGGPAGGHWRHRIYATRGRFPHLTDVPRFAADVRHLL